ncbi:unnamed protein product, partial [Brachionus calyciflorus]
DKLDFDDLEINGDYALTSNKCEFLRYDKKSKTDQSLKILSESDEWFMDGTFKSAPKQLMQLFTIHALIRDQNSSTITTILTCVYILTQRRSKNAYKQIFKVLKDKAFKNNISLNPKKVMVSYGTFRDGKLADNAAQQNFNNNEDVNSLRDQTEIPTVDPISFENELSTYVNLETVNIQVSTNYNPPLVEEQEYDNSTKTRI